MDSAVLTVLVNAGTAGIAVILMMTGWLVPKWIYKKLEKENKALREAYELQRQRSIETASQGVITNQLIQALVDVAEQRKQDRGKNLTWKDISL